MRRKRSARRARIRAHIAPPLRAGINASEIRLPEFDAQGQPVTFRTLGEWAKAGWGDAALAAFAAGDYLGDGNVVLHADTCYQPGRRVWVFRPVLDEPQIPIKLNIAAENERYLVVEKPHGMATIPRGSHVANTVTVAARRQFANDFLVAAHRLDLETAGLVLLTKAAQYRAQYQLMFQQRKIKKTYFAAAPIIPALLDRRLHHFELLLYRPEGQISVAVYDFKHADISMIEPLNTLNANKIREKGLRKTSTEIRLLRVIDKKEFLEERTKHISLLSDLPDMWGIYELFPHSGYMHQLRVTMQYLGAPIFGDPLYPVRLSKEAEAQRDFPLQLLARELEFDDPVTGEHLHLRSAQDLALDLAASFT